MTRRVSSPPPARSPSVASKTSSVPSKPSPTIPSGSSLTHSTSLRSNVPPVGYHKQLKTSKNDLLSIVESVHAHPPPPPTGSALLSRPASATHQHRRSASQPRESTGGIDIPKAPPPMPRVDLESLIAGWNPPKSWPATAPATDTTAPAADVRPRGRDDSVKQQHTGGSTLSAAAKPIPVGGSTLRSALKRDTPSPSPTGTPPSHSPSPTPQQLPVQATAALHPRAVSPRPSVPIATPRPNGKAPRRPRPVSSHSQSSSDSGASMQSFETGREFLVSDSDTPPEEEEGDVTITNNPSPTEADAGSMIDDDTSTTSEASQASTATGGTATPPALPPPQEKRPLPPPKVASPVPRINTDPIEGGDGAVTTQRRKSVRVSLQPTFSPTPPAMDDWESPWETDSRRNVEENNSDDSEGHARTSSSASRDSGRGRDTDMWQDSSDEDEEYVRARRMLSR